MERFVANWARPLDVVIADYGLHVMSVFLGIWNGSFRAQKRLPTGNLSIPFSPVIGDSNNNRRSDIAVADASRNKVRLFLDFFNRTNQATVRVIYLVRPFWIAAADFNGDGNLDMAMETALLSGQKVFQCEMSPRLGSSYHPMSIAAATKISSLPMAVRVIYWSFNESVTDLFRPSRLIRWEKISIQVGYLLVILIMTIAWISLWRTIVQQV